MYLTAFIRVFHYELPNSPSNLPMASETENKKKYVLVLAKEFRVTREHTNACARYYSKINETVIVPKVKYVARSIGHYTKKETYHYITKDDRNRRNICIRGLHDVLDYRE